MSIEWKRVSFEKADKSLSKYLVFPVKNSVCLYRRDNTSRADAVIYHLTSNGEGYIKLGTITIVDEDGMAEVSCKAEAGEVAEKNFNLIAKGWYDELLKIDATSTPAASGKEKPAPPERDAPLSQWFDYYHAMKEKGWTITLKDIAGKTSKTHDYIRQEHANYQSGPSAPGKEPKRRPHKERTNI